MRIKEIAEAIEQYAPLRLQEEWDNAGIQVGDPEAEVQGVLLCTDATEAVVAEAIERGFNLVIAHHPLIFRGLKKIMGRTPVERAVAMAIKHDITIYSAHTNMDSAWQGVSFRMADKIGMKNVQFLDVNDVPPYGDSNATTAGCGVIGDIEPAPAREVLQRVKAAFEVGAVRYSGDGDTIVGRVACAAVRVVSCSTRPWPWAPSSMSPPTCVTTISSTTASASLSPTSGIMRANISQKRFF